MIGFWFAAPSLACSVMCSMEDQPPGLAIPADGEVEVPIDARPVVAGVFGGDVGLSTVDGTPVDAEFVDLRDGFRQVVPQGELAPDTTYEVTGNGGRLGSFTTGTERADGLVPPPSDLTVDGRVSLDLRPGHGLTASCGGMGEEVVLATGWTGGTGLYEVEAVEEEGGRSRLLALGPHVDLGWSMPCLSTLPDLEAGEDVQIRVRSIDAAGRKSEWSETIVTSAREAEPGGCSTGRGTAGAAGLVLALLAIGRRTRPQDRW